MLAAFLGMMLELDAFEPVFAEPGEGAEDALARVRPVLVVLLHSELDAASSDLFFARAARTGARIILFGAADGAADVREAARRRRVPFFEMPVERAVLARVVADVARDESRSRTPTDRRAQAYDDPDGTMCFTDDGGNLWRVYDRRGAERRAHPVEAADVRYRAFVNERGEERRYAPRPRESLELSIDALIRQLAAATPAIAGED